RRIRPARSPTTRPRRSTTARTRTGSTRIAARTTSASSCRAMSSSPSEALRVVLEHWPGGVDIVPASTLDRHSFATTRPVAVLLDAPVDRALLLKHYPAETLDRATSADGLLLPPAAAAFGDLPSVTALPPLAERLHAP